MSQYDDPDRWDKSPERDGGIAEFFLIALILLGVPIALCLALGVL